MDYSNATAFLVTKHAVGTIIQRPPQHEAGPWSLFDMQVGAVRRDKGDPQAPLDLSDMEIETQRREWLKEDPRRKSDNFTPVERPARDPLVDEIAAGEAGEVITDYLDETVYALWYLS